MPTPQHRAPDTTAPKPTRAPEPAAPTMLANPRRSRLAHIRSYEELCTAATNRP